MKRAGIRAAAGWLIAGAALSAFGMPEAREFFVCPSGCDGNPGTREAPFRSLRHAAERLQPGDVCWIRQGVYRETVRPAGSGTAERPVRFAAWNGESVVVSGADPLDVEWAPFRGGVFQAETELRFLQLFVNGRMMHEARWPNSPLDDLMAMKRAEAGPGTGYEELRSPELPEGDWEGAVVLIWPGRRWYNATRRIADYRPGEGFRFDRCFRPARPDTLHGFDPRKPEPGNPFILFGALAGLDSPGEWFLDEASGRVYLWPPDGGPPDAVGVEVKQRDLAFDLSGLSHIHLEGLQIFAAAVCMEGASHCRVADCHFRHIEHLREFDGFVPPETKNRMTGRSNAWTRCSLAGSAASALRIGGEGNRLENSIVRDANYLGSYRGALDLRHSTGAVVRSCTLFRAGRDIIQHHGSRRIRILRNELFEANLLNNDSGAIYAWGTDGDGGVIAFNWIHSNRGALTKGIYMDNFCGNFLIHHNVLWNNSYAITLNSDSTNNLVVNNTLARNGVAFSTFTYSGRTPNQRGTRILNNLVVGLMREEDPRRFVQGEWGPEIDRNGAHAMDRRGVPVQGSGAIGAGLRVPGITDGHSGDAPDIGAYAFGGEYWTAGADWDNGLIPSRPPADLRHEPIQLDVTGGNMVADGLVLWLDAAAPGSVETDGEGRVLKWRDRSGREHHARPFHPRRLCRFAPDTLNGLPVVRGDGVAFLVAGPLRDTRGPVTAFVVARGLEPAGPPWQRILSASEEGASDDYREPGWMIMRRGGLSPAAFPAAVFHRQYLEDRTLDRVAIFGSSIPHESQGLAGEVAEALIFNRALLFEEESAVELYLIRKWGLKEAP